MADRYIQTLLPEKVFQELKVQAIYRSQTLIILTKEILIEWVNNLKIEKEEVEDGGRKC